MTQSEALAILKTGANVFLSGEPGSGKTHTVNAYVAYLRASGIEPAITASTGIAATHIGGMTIHSWSGIGIRPTLSRRDLDKIAQTEYVVKRVARAHVLIIDEVSMLAPGTLDMVEAVCREVRRAARPFGGLQVVLVGDFFQLPPVVRRDRENNEEAQLSLGDISPAPARFAYHADSWARLRPQVCYLTGQYRQDDRDFLTLLAAIRGNVFNHEHLSRLQERKITHDYAPASAPKLFSHNVDVDRVNDATLARLAGPARVFKMNTKGSPALVAALTKGCLSPNSLALKVGAVVMFTKNSPRFGFVNGTLGCVHGFGKQNGAPIVKTRDGRIIAVEPMEWTIEENGKIRASLSQFPLRLAWAITVHKSQGMSMDEAVMDLSQSFEYGQGYVALSRVRRLAGLYLLGWNERAFMVHPDVLTADAHFRTLSLEGMETLAAVSNDELAKHHSDFIKVCGGKAPARRSRYDVLQKDKVKDSKPNRKLPTEEVTKELIAEGKTIKEAAARRGVSFRTIVAHLEKLRATGNLPDISHLRPPAPHFEKMAEAFRKVGSTEKLTPAKLILPDSFSFDDLRLARLFL